MSNINAENITVTNLNVAYINGQPVTSLNCYNQPDDCYDCSQENTDCPHCIDLPQTYGLGETGPKGDTGDTGPAGPAGPKGDSGDQISIGITSTNTIYTTSEIVFNDLNGFSITNVVDENKILVDYTLPTSPPPKIEFKNSVSDLRYIYTYWDYPAQINGGSFEMFLPLIKYLTVSWTAKISGIGQTGRVILENQADNCIKYNGITQNANYITGIVLTNSGSGNEGIQFKVLKFPDNVDRYCCVYYNSKFLNMEDSSYNKITAYYSNYSGYSPSSISFTKFLNSGPPGAPPGAPECSNNIVDGENVKMTITSVIIPENLIMEIDPSNKLGFSIIEYKATGTSLPSFKRYSGYNKISDSRTFTSLTNIIYANNLHPDSGYTFKTSAKNNSASTEHGPSSVESSFTTVPIHPKLNIFPNINTIPVIFNNSTVISANVISAKIAYNNEVVSVYTNLNEIQINNINVPIHYLDTRGSSNDKLLSVKVIHSTTQGNIADSGEIIFGGFGKPVTSVTSKNGFTISASKTEAYPKAGSADTDHYLAGYYLNANYSIKYSTSNPNINSPYKNTITLVNQTYGNLNDSLSEPPAVNPFSGSPSYRTFYKDTFTTLPSISSEIGSDFVISENINTSYKRIAGIIILENSQIKLNTRTNAINMGQYFYRNGTLLQYISNIPDSNVSNGIVSAMPSGSYNETTKILNTTILFNNSVDNPVLYSSSVYSNNCQLKVTPHSWMGQSGSNATSNNLNVIFDPKSLELINNLIKYPTTIVAAPYVDANGSIFGVECGGYRIWSSIANAAGVINLPTPTSHAHTSYGYNHNWNIAADLNSNQIQEAKVDVREELLLYDGKYISANFKNGNNGYMDYSNYLSGIFTPQPDYSIIKTETKNRYATFVWQCSSIVQPYLYCKFVIYGCTVPVNTDLKFNQSEIDYQMKLFFRFEDSRDRITYTNTFNNTTWIDATKSDNSAPMFFLEKNGVAGGKDSSRINNCVPDNNGTYTVILYTSFPPIFSNNQNGASLHLIARMQIPMKADIGFSYITARVGTVSAF